MLENTFFYVHIPKTGGTSFRKAFESYLGSSRTYYDYGTRSSVTSNIIKKIKYASEVPDLFLLSFSEIANEDISLICGHVDIMDYAYVVSPEKIITFIRNPVERVISHYEHMKRKEDYTKSLKEFCQEKRFQNLQHRMLNGYPLHAIGFIGLTENFNTSLIQLQNEYKLNLPKLQLNQNNKKNLNSTYHVDDETKSLIASMNELDIVLYKTVKKLFSTKAANTKSCRVYGCIQILNENRVIGWAYKVDENKKPLTIEVLVNGKQQGTTNAVIFRTFFKQINSPRDGYIGFDYQFKKKIKTSDTITCRVKDTDYFLTDLLGNTSLTIKK